ncbi:MAG: hypothetical protein IPM79_37855 [Polyangiaceae bacterium]|nr:hypothetical protein [Polyangiaceae bacterium]
MKREDLIAYARRDWSTLAEVKREFLLTRRAKLGAAVNFEVVDTLRAQVHAQRPDYPRTADRQADLDAHILLADRLRRASTR